MKFGMFGLGAAAPEVARRIAEEQARKRLAGQTEITSRNMDPLMGDGGFPLTRGGQDMRSKAAQQNWADMRSQLQARPAADRTTRFAGEMPAAATGSMLSDGAPMQPVKRAGLGSAIGAAMRRKMPELGMMGRGPSGASPNTASSLTSANAPLTREQMARDYNINVPNFGGTGPTLNSSGVPVMRSSEPLSASQPTPSMGAFGRGPVPGSYAARNNMQNAQPNFFESMIGYDPNEMDVSSLQYFFMSPQGRDKSRDRVDLEEAKAKLTSYMEKLNLSPDEQYAIEMSEDPLKAIDARNARQQQMQAVKEMGPEALQAYNAGVFEEWYKERIKGDDADKWEHVTFGDDGLAAFNPKTGQYVDYRQPTPTTADEVRPSESLSKPTYRPPTPEEMARWRLDPEVSWKINDLTGEPEAISSGKLKSDYSQTQQNKFIQQAQTLDAVEGALKTYLNLIKEYGPQVWTTGPGGDNAVAKQLDAARTAILIQAKELFNLGVLNGPDLDIIESAIPKVTGSDALGKDYKSASAQLSVLGGYIARGRNQIPPEFIEKARPQGRPFSSDEESGANNGQSATRFSDQQVDEARLTLRNWSRLPAGVATPQLRALTERIANTKKSDEMSDEELESMLAGAGN